MSMLMCLMYFYVHFKNLCKDTEGTGNIGCLWEVGLVAGEQSYLKYFSLFVLLKKF